jgi:hypothetical protein
MAEHIKSLNFSMSSAAHKERILAGIYVYSEDLKQASLE